MKSDRLRPLFSQPLFVTAAAVFCTMLWGSAFPFIKIGYASFGIGADDVPGQLLFAGARFAAAGVLVLCAGALSSNTRLRMRPGGKDLPFLALLAFFQTFLQYLLLYIGLTRLSGSRSAVLTSVSVFASVLLSAVFFPSDSLNARKGLGCLMGLAGLLLLHAGPGGEGFSLLGDGAVILSNVSGAVGNILLKKQGGEKPPAFSAGWQLFLGGAALCAVGAAGGGKLDLSCTAGTLTLLYLSFMAGTAFLIWTFLLSHHPVSRVAAFNLLIPVFGSLWSALILRENVFSLAFLLALAAVCGGIFLVVTPKKASPSHL